MTDGTDPDSPQTFTYAYDRNGSTVSKSDSRITDGDIAFSYDSRDQLVQVTRGPPENRTLLGQYDYNYAGLRVRQRFGDRGNIDYFYDGSAVIEERDAVTKALTAHYRYADRLISLDTGTEKAVLPSRCARQHREPHGSGRKCAGGLPARPLGECHTADRRQCEPADLHRAGA